MKNNRKSNYGLNGVQLGFGFTESLWGSRDGVLSLRVWEDDAGKWDGQCTVNGGRRVIGYETWLRWFSPLSHSVGTFTLSN
jgi:hypothetical protein